jgi:hypothetical protein
MTLARDAGKPANNQKLLNGGKMHEICFTLRVKGKGNFQKGELK